MLVSSFFLIISLHPPFWHSFPHSHKHVKRLKMSNIIDLSFIFNFNDSDQKTILNNSDNSQNPIYLFNVVDHFFILIITNGEVSSKVLKTRKIEGCQKSWYLWPNKIVILCLDIWSWHNMTRYYFISIHMRYENVRTIKSQEIV